MVITKAQPLRPAERKVQFFRVARDINGQRHRLNWTAVSAHLQNLAPNTTGRFVDDGKGDYYFIDSHNGSSENLLFAITRHSNLPSLESGGILSPLALPANHGLAEIVHIRVVDPFTIAAVYNHYGPRIIPRLRNYIAARTPAHLRTGLYVKQLCLADTLTRLEALRDVRTFEINVTPGGADLIKQADRDLGNAFDAAMAVGHPQELQLRLRATRYGRLDGIKDRIRNVVGALKGQQQGAISEYVKTLSASGFDPEIGRSVPIDFLEDFLIVNKKIMRESATSRSLDDDSAFQSLSEAYEEMKEHLAEAAEVD